MRNRGSLTVARVRKLGLDFATITDADAHLGRRYDLPRLLADHPELHAAWKRGQLLRDVYRLSRAVGTRHEAAQELHLTIEEFDAIVTKDLEAAELWNRGKLDTSIWLKQQILARAGEGKAQAIKQVENILRSEIAAAQFNPRRVAEPVVCEIFGVTRQTLNIWHREKGCPRNAGETTYDLVAMVAWYGRFVRARAAGQTAPDINPLQDVKARRLELELRARQGELLEAESVRAGLLVRERALLALLEHKPEELAHVLAGKTRQEIQPILVKFTEDLRYEWAAAIDQGTTKQREGDIHHGSDL